MELPELPDWTTAYIAALYRESHAEILSWIDPGVPTPSGLLRLPARRRGDGTLVVRRKDLSEFLRRRYPETDLVGGRGA